MICSWKEWSFGHLRFSWKFRQESKTRAVIYGVYQDWVHQNPGDHLDGGIAEDSKWQAYRRKLVCMPTQRYDAPSGKVGKIFVGILSVELDGVHASKRNTVRVIIFQSVILQRTQGINNSAQILKRVLFQLDL